MKGNENGFNLIEIMIVVAVIGIFAGLSLASFRFFNTSRVLEGEEKKIVSALELAKKKTIAGEKPACTIEFDGRYQLTWNASSYKLQSCCNTLNSCPTEIITWDMPSGITFVSADNVIFKKFGLGVESEKTITITNTAGTTKTITIDGYGNIN